METTPAEVHVRLRMFCLGCFPLPLILYYMKFFGVYSYFLKLFKSFFEYFLLPLAYVFIILYYMKPVQYLCILFLNILKSLKITRGIYYMLLIKIYAYFFKSLTLLWHHYHYMHQPQRIFQLSNKIKIHWDYTHWISFSNSTFSKCFSKYFANFFIAPNISFS